MKRIREFEALGATELMFVWHYANPTSDLMAIENDMDRVIKALELSNFTPTKVVKDDILRLVFSENMAVAIDRMRRMEPDARLMARKMISSILKNYKNLCDPTSYQDEDGNMDTTKYVNSTTKIAQELPNMIAKLEEGFGVSSRSDDEDEQSVGYSRDWYLEQSEK